MKCYNTNENDKQFEAFELFILEFFINILGQSEL